MHNRRGTFIAGQPVPANTANNGGAAFGFFNFNPVMRPLPTQDRVEEPKSKTKPGGR